MMRCIKALYVCIHEQEAYEATTISQEDINNLAKAYFDEHPDDYNLADFAKSLAVVSHRKYVIPLSYPTKLRAVKSFYTCAAALENFSLEDGDPLWWRAVDGANNFP
jgi:hypothetical protein